MITKILKACVIPMLITCVGAAQTVETFSGEIMDDLCAKTKSHAKMMQEMKSMTSDPVVCTRKCVQLGAHYVLYDRQKDVMYKLDNPDKAEPFAGKTVQISGTLAKNKIKIATIEATGPAAGVK
jgi:hypothetical protein